MSPPQPDLGRRRAARDGRTNSPGGSATSKTSTRKAARTSTRRRWPRWTRTGRKQEDSRVRSAHHVFFLNPAVLDHCCSGHSRFVLGIAYMARSGAIAKDFKLVITDHRRVVTMALVSQGLALCFIGIVRYGARPHRPPRSQRQSGFVPVRGYAPCLWPRDCRHRRTG